MKGEARSKKRRSSLNLNRYLDTCSRLTEELPFDNSGRLSFHWANWEDSCLKQIENTKYDTSKLFKLERELNEYKDVKVWLKTRHQVKELSLYDLYESYSDNRLRMTWFDREDEILLSVDNSSGPYMTLSSMRWFDRSTYQKFIYRKILVGPVQYRKFRINSNIETTVRVNGSPLDEFQVGIHQISQKGLLFKIANKANYEKIMNSEFISFSFNVGPFEHMAGKRTSLVCSGVGNSLKKENLVKVAVMKKELQKYHDKFNEKSSANIDYYVFINFEDLFYKKNNEFCKVVMRKYVNKVRDHLSELMYA